MEPVIARPRNQSNGEYIYDIKFPDGFTSGRFTNAGTYEITLTLRSDNYVWQSDASKPKNEQQRAHKVNFIINPQENEWEINPSIRHWQWGYFDRETTRVEGAPAKGDATFTVYTDRDCLNPAAGLQDFAVVDGMVPDTRVQAFKNLLAGTYYLQAKVAPDKNYTGLTSHAIEFTVGVARNFWQNNLNLIRWTYGSFDPQVNVITAKPTFGESVVLGIYRIDGDSDTALAGLENIQIDENGVIQGAAAEILATLDGGSYRLKARVIREVAGYSDEDMNEPIYNYSELNGNIDFVIAAATNFWVSTPYIQRWIVGEQIYEPTATPKWGKANFVITNPNGDVIYDTKTGVNNLATALPGWHTLTTTVESDGVNYSSLNATMRFRVFGTEINFWRSVPNIQGWVEGETANLPTASAAFGNVVYSYKTVDGTVLDGVPTEAGEYILVATAKHAEFEDLIAEVHFTIEAKPVVVEHSDTGYIVAVTVLAVLVAAAVATIVAVVVINKKKSKPVHARPFNDDSRSDI